MKDLFHCQNYKTIILGTAILSAFVKLASADYSYSQYNSGEILLSPWDWSVPPSVYNGNKVVPVDFDMDFEQVIGVDEHSMVIDIKFI